MSDADRAPMKKPPEGGFFTLLGWQRTRFKRQARKWGPCEGA